MFVRMMSEGFVKKKKKAFQIKLVMNWEGKTDSIHFLTNKRQLKISLGLK